MKKSVRKGILTIRKRRRKNKGIHLHSFNGTHQRGTQDVFFDALGNRTSRLEAPAGFPALDNGSKYRCLGAHGNTVLQDDIGSGTRVVLSVWFDPEGAVMLLL